MSKNLKTMEDFIIEYPSAENTDALVEATNAENTDFEQVLDNISGEFIQEEGGLNMNNNWYCLPYILSNRSLSSQKNIENVTSTEVGDNVSIKVTYKPHFISTNRSEFDSETCEYYIDENELNTVTYTVPEDKKYICKIIVSKGVDALDTEFIKKYILA